MPRNPFRAHFDPLNETNGTCKRNFLEMLVKIVNYSALKGLRSRFWPATLYLAHKMTSVGEILLHISHKQIVKLTHLITWEKSEISLSDVATTIALNKIYLAYDCQCHLLIEICFSFRVSFVQCSYKCAQHKFIEYFSRLLSRMQCLLCLSISEC